MRLAFLLLALTLPVFSLAHADDRDTASAEALSKTLVLLKNPEARNKAIEKDPNAIKADQTLKQLGLNADSQEDAYAISGELLEKLVKETGGDTVKMKERVNELMRNPAGLEGELTSEQRLKIKKMADETKAKAP